MTLPGISHPTLCTACGASHPAHEPCPSSAGARSGTVLGGKYELVRLLGQGGMGEVYEGRHVKIGRRVAVKFLHAHFASEPEVARRFENEALAAGGIEHENIAAVYDVGALPDLTQYLVMEFLEGEDLSRLLERDGRLPLGRAVDIVAQAALGLELVHLRGIVHRDLKPANLFMAKRPNGADIVKVLDFGIAKLRQGEGAVSSTKTGTALGTAYYMSPEQARGDRDIGPASDIYALGVILYELLSGQHPHDGDSLLQILHRVLTQPPTPLEDVAPGLPPAIYAAVRKAMAMNVADRFESVTDFAAAIVPYANIARAPHYAVAASTRAETASALRPSANPVETIAQSASPLVASVVGVAHSTPAAGAKRGRTTVVGAIALAISAAAGVGILALRHVERPVTTAPLPSTAVVAAVAPPTALASVPLPSVSIPAAATPVAPALDRPRAKPVVNAPPPAPPVAPTVASAAAPPKEHVAAKLDCSPPFYYDAKGNQIFKLECVE